ncbi:hypothetical protein EG329_012119 [Mollisiaceae sp. DMI_Dod_QoI]|nr:hypothetical protein EG329_012119 [Helotiales sp. DMI_Dod_QoI]
MSFFIRLALFLCMSIATLVAAQNAGTGVPCSQPGQYVCAANLEGVLTCRPLQMICDPATHTYQIAAVCFEAPDFDYECDYIEGVPYCVPIPPFQIGASSAENEVQSRYENGGCSENGTRSRRKRGGC